MEQLTRFMPWRLDYHMKSLFSCVSYGIASDKKSGLLGTLTESYLSGCRDPCSRMRKYWQFKFEVVAGKGLLSGGIAFLSFPCRSNLL
jgi:hypothetical protein